MYDAVYDAEFVTAWLELMRTEGKVGGAQGHLSRSRVALPKTPPLSVKVLSGEQSNTSVIIDDGDSAAIVKIFRVLAAGKNPEVELGAALTAAGTSEVPATLGWVTGSWHEPASSGSIAATGELTVAHEFLAGGMDAWRLAVEAAAAGKDFTAEARGLGAATATVHARLAETFGTQDGQEQGGPDIIATVARRVRGSWAEASSAVGPYDENLDELLAALDPRDVGQLQRVHGDLHLGQILLVPGAEGQPDDGPSSTSKASRSGPSMNAILPICRCGTSRACCVHSITQPVPPRAKTKKRPSKCLKPGWMTALPRSLRVTAKSPPGTIDRRSPLFVALWLDKALYEVVYELRNRPDWLSIPVNASRRILDNTSRGKHAAATAEGNDMTGSARTERPRVPLHVDSETLERVAAGAYHAPHSILGAHLDDHGHVTIRTVKHLAKSVVAVTEAAARK